jgi:hypothetical protein
VGAFAIPFLPIMEFDLYIILRLKDTNVSN